MAEGRAARRLGALAALLEAERAPYYVRRPIPPALRTSFPAEGWYWVPAGHHVAVYLAGGYEDALIVLHTQLQERDDGT